MIGRIQGKLIEKQAPMLLLDVAGVGYEVAVPMTSFFNLPQVGEQVTLSTHFVVREDAQQLFGFSSVRDRDLFRILIKVSGIGPKVALALLSGMTGADVVECIRRGDSTSLKKLPGIGPKTAERLIVETRDQLKDGWAEPASAGNPVASPAAPGDPASEAEAALEALGYKPAEAARAVASVAGDSGQSAEALIRSALKSLA